MELKKNDIYETEIIDYTTEGSGICKINGIAVFVPATVVGDRARVRIVKTAKNYAYGKLEELLVPSTDRICSDCDSFVKCGGCSFRHIRYESELQYKHKYVVDALTRIGGADSSLIQEIVGAESPDHYRNKAQLPITLDSDGKVGARIIASSSSFGAK